MSFDIEVLSINTLFKILKITQHLCLLVLPPHGLPHLPQTHPLLPPSAN